MPNEICDHATRSVSIPDLSGWGFSKKYGEVLNKAARAFELAPRNNAPAATKIPNVPEFQEITEFVSD
jgi:hypothetical protein